MSITESYVTQEIPPLDAIGNNGILPVVWHRFLTICNTQQSKK
jgi:hypothetical protein